VAGGLALISNTPPDVLFLDIELGESSGFELLEALGNIRPHVIFTTAHEGYAIKAVRFSALDYLLKPIDPQELGVALGKATDSAHLMQHPAQFMALLTNLTQRLENSRRLALPVGEGLEMVTVADILSCESDGHYTVLRLADKRRLTVARNLGQFEEMLDASRFIRVHHSFLVNIAHVSRYVRGEGGELVLTDGTVVQVSRRKKQDLIDLLGRV